MPSKRKSWILRYSVLWVCVMLPLVLLLVWSGGTLYWGTDALQQQYTTLRYVHDALRSLFSGKGFEMVDLSLGQGLDAIGTLSYYGLTDPTLWPVVLFSGKGIEFYYHFLIFFYIFISGLLFGVYLRRVGLLRGDDPWPTALGALLFATCGYQLAGIIRNPYYASGSIYLLLLLIAVERLLRERKWRMLSLCAALMVMANFYLAYQTSLLVAIYCLIRLIARLRGGGNARGFLSDGLRILGSYLLGLMLSAVILLPVAYSFLISGRTSVASGYTASLLHYPWQYYFKLAALFAVPYDYAGFWALQSFSPLAVFGVAVLFERCGHALDERAAQRTQLRVGFITLLICLCVPLAGKIFNGFGYVTNRWSYGWALVVCMATALALPSLADPAYGGRKRLSLFALAAGMLALLHALVVNRLPAMSGAGNLSRGEGMGFDFRVAASLIGAAALFLFALFILWLQRRLRRDPRCGTRLLALAGALCCGVWTLGFGWISASGVEFSTEGAEEQIARDPATAVTALADDGYSRVDTGFTLDNWGDAIGFRGTSYYWSLIPGWTGQSYEDLEMPTLRWQFRLHGLDGDSYLNALSCVRYAVRASDETGGDMATLPLGFSLMEDQTDGDVLVYENEYALPLGYVFTEVMPEAEYALLDPVRKREALLSAAVLHGDEGAQGLPHFEGELPCEVLDWHVESGDGLQLTENELSGEALGTLYLAFDGAPDSEIYLRMSGTQAQPLAADDTELAIATQCEAGTGGIYVICPDSMFNYPQQGVCHRLGWSEAGMKECGLRLMAGGSVKFDSFELCSVPASFFREAASRLRETGWQPELEPNRVHGSTRMAQDGILQISLPWSPGWSATVDGEPAELYRCGGMYMGLRLGAGEHEIELDYVTPGLIPGACLSLTALVILLALGVAKRLRHG